MDTHLRLTRLHHTVQKSSSASESESLVQNCLRFRHRVEFFFFLHFQKTSEAKGRGTLSSDDYPATTAQRNGIAPPAKWSIKTESRTGEMRDATNCCELCPHTYTTNKQKVQQVILQLVATNDGSGDNDLGGDNRRRNNGTRDAHKLRTSYGHC